MPRWCRVAGKRTFGWRQISELTGSPTGGWLVVRTLTPTSGAGNILAIRPPNELTPLPIVLTRASEYTPTLSPAKGGPSPRWSHHGKELLYVDGESNLVAAQVTTTPFFSVERTTVLFNTGHFVGEGASRRNYDVAPDDQRFLMIRRATSLASAQLFIVEHCFKEIKTKALR